MSATEQLETLEKHCLDKVKSEFFQTHNVQLNDGDAIPYLKASITDVQYENSEVVSSSDTHAHFLFNGVATVSVHEMEYFFSTPLLDEPVRTLLNGNMFAYIGVVVEVLINTDRDRMTYMAGPDEERVGVTMDFDPDYFDVDVADHDVDTVLERSGVDIESTDRQTRVLAAREQIEHHIKNNDVTAIHSLMEELHDQLLHSLEFIKDEETTSLPEN